MGLSTLVGVGRDLQDGSSPQHLPREGILMINPTALLANPSKVSTPRVLQFLTRSKVMAIGWTAMSIWLGVMWIQAGSSKLWGAESAAFLHGAGIKGFASHGVPAYTWWGTFLH